MKRTQRHHLKENEIETFVRETRELIQSRGREAGILAVAVLVIVAIVGGYYGWRQHEQAQAAALLADAMAVQGARIGPPPAPGTVDLTPYFPTERERDQAALTKFKIAADAYPRTDAGLYARYQEGATLIALGDPKDAAAAYQQVIDGAGDRIYGQMARLGLAEADARAGNYDRAIKAYSELALRKDGPLPVDGILMQLGRTYLDAGKPADAQQTFNRLVEEFPESPFTADARKELDNLKKT